MVWDRGATGSERFPRLAFVFGGIDVEGGAAETFMKCIVIVGINIISTVPAAGTLFTKYNTCPLQLIISSKASTKASRLNSSWVFVLYTHSPT